MRRASTYRAARRNECSDTLGIREWGPRFYYGRGPTVHRRTVLPKRPSRYHPNPAVSRFALKSPRQIRAGAR